MPIAPEIMSQSIINDEDWSIISSLSDLDDESASTPTNTSESEQSSASPQSKAAHDDTESSVQPDESIVTVKGLTPDLMSAVGGNGEQDSIKPLETSNDKLAAEKTSGLGESDTTICKVTTPAAPVSASVNCSSASSNALPDKPLNDDKLPIRGTIIQSSSLKNLPLPSNLFIALLSPFRQLDQRIRSLSKRLYQRMTKNRLAHLQKLSNDNSFHLTPAQHVSLAVLELMDDQSDKLIYYVLGTIVAVLVANLHFAHPVRKPTLSEKVGRMWDKVVYIEEKPQHDIFSRYLFVKRGAKRSRLDKVNEMASHFSRVGRRHLRDSQAQLLLHYEKHLSQLTNMWADAVHLEHVVRAKAWLSSSSVQLQNQFNQFFPHVVDTSKCWVNNWKEYLQSSSLNAYRVSDKSWTTLFEKDAQEGLKSIRRYLDVSSQRVYTLATRSLASLNKRFCQAQ